jgi:large subunit ribosomal protein L35
MERLHQMHVVPDVVPDLHPSLDLRVSFPEHQTKVASMAPKYKFVEPGVYLLPEQVRFFAAS